MIGEPKDGPGSPPLPRWVKAIGLAVIGGVVLGAALHFTGLGGPGVHLAGGPDDGSPSGATEHTPEMHGQ